MTQPSVLDALGNANFTILLQLSEEAFRRQWKTKNNFIAWRDLNINLPLYLPIHFQVLEKNQENKVPSLLILWNYFILQALIN